MRSFRFKAVGSLLTAVLVGVAASVSAQSFPTKPVTMVIPFLPGSATDIVGRIVTNKLSEMWGQAIVNDNKSGAGGSIGAAIVARAAPDGYTLVLNSNAHTVNPAIYAKLPYDTLKDFTDIVPLAVQPNVLVVTASSPIKNLAEFIAYAKAKPGALNFGNAGIGSATHLSAERLLASADIKATNIPFKGTPEVVAAMLSGAVDCYFVPISAGLSNIRAGKLRALAVSTAKRNSQLPDVPTTGEAGAPNADSPIWFGIWGPAGMSAELVNKISADVRRALADAGVREKLGALGNDTMDMSPAEFAKYVRSEMDTYKRVLEAAGIKPQ